MKIQRTKIIYQWYIIPAIRITYDKFLNGNYELSFIWGKWELDITF
jgi:hypothetical protein